MLGVALLSLLFVACGDGFNVVESPRIEVSVNGVGMPDDLTGVVIFPTANQLPVVRAVSITNPGTSELTISNIGWKPGRDDGGVFQNDFVELDLGNITFPLVLGASSVDKVEFNVTFTPPKDGSAPTDFSDSVLVVDSDAKDQLGQVNVPQVAVTFEMTKSSCIPEINPPNYTFTNATPTTPETQVFSIVQNPQASGPCTVTSVQLNAPSSVYQITDRPVAGTIIQPPNQLDYIPAPFSVRFTPSGGNNDPTVNSVLVTVNGQLLTVPLKANSQTGSYQISYSHANKLDFGSVSSGQECRRVLVVSEGPGVLKVEEPSLEPAEAGLDFDDIKAYIPATSPNDPETLITSWPRGLAKGKSIEFEVCYNAQGDPSQSQNGKLNIPIATPALGTIVVDVFAGSPKPLLDIAPTSNAVLVSASLADAETGVRHVVLYNNGNADLTVVSAVTTGKFIGTVAEVFSVTDPTDFSTPIPPGGLMVLELSYDASKVAIGQSSAGEQLDVTYVNGFTGAETTENLVLNLEDAAGATIPTADAGTYADVEAGTSVFLTSADSAPGDGTFSGPYASWFLTGKPDGSRAELNAGSGTPFEFRPDIAGAYTVELIVYSSFAGEVLYSAPVTTTINAIAAE